MTLTLGPLLSICALNYSGFCVRNGRFLSEREKLLAAVDRVAVGDMVFWYRSKSFPNDMESVRIDRPDTAEAFLAANPTCCRLVPAGGDVRKPSFVGRALGEVSDVAQVDHVEQVPDEQGVLHSESIRTHVYLSPCGEVVRDFLP